MKRVWLWTLLYTICWCLPMSLFFWLLLLILFPQLLIGFSVWVMLALSLIGVGVAGWRMFAWLKVRMMLKVYTEKFQLTPKVLAVALQEPLINFSYGNHHRVIYRLGGVKNEQRLLEAVVRHFGELDA